MRHVNPVKNTGARHPSQKHRARHTLQMCETSVRNGDALSPPAVDQLTMHGGHRYLTRLIGAIVFRAL